MNDLLVIVPSRGRPENIWRLLGAWDDPVAEIAVYLDQDDPQLNDYPHVEACVVLTGPRLWTVPKLNRAALGVVDQYRYVGFIGDDCLPRTSGWGRRVLAALDELGTGIVYCNDLFRSDLPCHWFMTSDIVRTLGYMLPPELHHMFADNAIKAWGEGMDRYRYLEDVVIEHLHPRAGKTAWDQLYRESDAMLAEDRVIFEGYMRGRYAEDLAKLRRLVATGKP